MTTACSAPLMKLPVLPAGGAPMSDASAIIAAATRDCVAVRTLTAEVAASGKVNGQRLRVRLTVGVEQPASARIEAMAPFGAPLFVFVAIDDEATLLMPRDDRVLQHGAPDRVLDAAAGVPLGAADLRTTLTGCPATAGGAVFAAGEDWRIVAGEHGDQTYLHRDRSPRGWAVAAATRHTDRGGWRAEYRDPVNGLPRSIRLMSVDAAGRATDAFDLTLGLSQVEINAPLDAAAFRVAIPATAQPITLEELRDARPGTRKN